MNRDDTEEINDSLRGTEPSSPACNATEDCRKAGGCYYCQVMSPFSPEGHTSLFEWRRDGEMDVEMRRKIAAGDLDGRFDELERDSDR